MLKIKVASFFWDTMYIVVLYTKIHYQFSETSSSGLHSSHHYVFQLMRRVHHVNIRQPGSWRSACCNDCMGLTDTDISWRRLPGGSRSHSHSGCLPPCISEEDLAGPI